jgi:hypothetical protein
MMSIECAITCQLNRDQIRCGDVTSERTCIVKLKRMQFIATSTRSKGIVCIRLQEANRMSKDKWRPMVQ